MADVALIEKFLKEQPGLNTLYRWQGIDRGKKPPFHSHRFYEIILVESGEIFYLVEGRRLPAGKGDVLLFPPGLRHQPLLGAEGQVVSYARHVIWLQADFWQQAMAVHPELGFGCELCRRWDEYIFRIPAAAYARLHGLCRILKEEVSEKRFGWELDMEVYIMEFMLIVNRVLYERRMHAPSFQPEQTLEVIKDYIEDHLDEKLTLEQVASELGFSPSSISHMFTRVTGRSFYQYVIWRRLLEAQEQMLMDVPLKEVWGRCGFPDYSAFYRAFRKEFGLSPKQYRKYIELS